MINMQKKCTVLFVTYYKTNNIAVVKPFMLYDIIY